MAQSFSPLLHVGKPLKKVIDGGTSLWTVSKRPGAKASSESDMSFSTMTFVVRTMSWTGLFGFVGMGMRRVHTSIRGLTMQARRDRCNLSYNIKPT